MIPEPLRTAGKGQVLCSCVLVPNGASAPTLEDAAGIIGVSRTGVGLITLTLAKKFYKLKAWGFAAKVNANAPTHVQRQGTADAYNAATPTIDIITMQGSPFVATDVAANANTRIALWFLFSESTVG